MDDEHTLRERLDWRPERGEIRDGDVRYLMIRPDSLMGMFAGLPPEARAAALAALGRSVAEGGRDSAQRYRAMGAREAERLIAAVEGAAAELGWGVWRFARRADGGLDLEVENSPFAQGYLDQGRRASESPVCAAIAGMAAAVAGLLAGTGVRARETDCRAMGAALCRFRAAPRAMREDPA